LPGDSIKVHWPLRKLKYKKTLCNILLYRDGTLILEFLIATIFSSDINHPSKKTNILLWNSNLQYELVYKVNNENTHTHTHTHTHIHIFIKAIAVESQISSNPAAKARASSHLIVEEENSSTVDLLVSSNLQGRLSSS
jgi:hypothetical protein